MELNDNNQQLGKQIGDKLIKSYQDVLTKNRKIATRRTYNSFTYEIIIQGDTLKIIVSADEGLFFIEAGKRANTKLPLRKQGGKFVLVQRLEDWKRAVAFGGSDFLLARAIAKNPRKGIPITDIMWEQVKRDIGDLIRQHYREAIVSLVRNRLREIYKKAF